ncbi:MAG: metallophosphoesterase [Oscillospiraceae bacterium]|nr:metallophosphoesterase [Oscillospiraceae bacterium]
MRILVMSDSHSAMRYMRLAVDTVKPDAVIHLGDHYDDAQSLAEEYRHIRFHILPGNCDFCRCPPDTPQVLCYSVGGVRFFMTHGHNHGVKSGTHRLVAAAREQNARAALYGHTHAADRRREDGLLILNPGACNCAEGSVAVIETENNEIASCEILCIQDLEEVK